MRDSRLGTYGGLAIVFCILIKVAAVISLAHLPVNTLFALLVCAPIVGRTGMVLVMYRQHYAREGAGMANAYLGHISGKETVITLCIGVALVGLLAGMQGRQHHHLDCRQRRKDLFKPPTERADGGYPGRDGRDRRNGLPAVASVGLMYAPISGPARTNSR